MSPYLYILVQQVLSCILSNLNDSNSLILFKIKGLKILYLIFADDVLIAFHTNPKSCVAILSSLDLFAKLTNLTSTMTNLISFFRSTTLLSPSIRYMTHLDSRSRLG